MPMAASIAKWGATVSARLGLLLRNAPMTGLRHAVHLPLTVGHPLWVILVDFGMSAACPVRGNLGNAACPVLLLMASLSRPTPGEAHDNRLCSALLSALIPETMLLADRGYDSD